MKFFKKIKKLKGFTLLELLVVIFIIGVLAGIISVSVSRARTNSRVAKVKSDLVQLNTAMELLLADTGEYPNHLPASPCVNTAANNEVYLNTCAAGLMCTDNNYANWRGPYIAKVNKDPWGSDYLLDSDYTCRSYVEGCQDMPDNTVVKALVSYGPNKVGLNAYNEPDNIVLVVCR